MTNILSFENRKCYIKLEKNQSKFLGNMLKLKTKKYFCKNTIRFSINFNQRQGKEHLANNQVFLHSQLLFFYHMFCEKENQKICILSQKGLMNLETFSFNYYKISTQLHREPSKISSLYYFKSLKMHCFNTSGYFFV